MIGTRIRIRRVVLGLTQVDLARAMAVTEVTIARWESGQTSPRVAVLDVLADVLETSAAWLVGGDLGDRGER
jgi:HTH-type transcriptional regulator, cell division transcriptional repressor